jgi:hypothetical protein
MRASYQFSLPIQQDKMMSHVSFLTFRNGEGVCNNKVPIHVDGERDSCLSLNPLQKSCLISNYSHLSRFGHPSNEITEGKGLFQRQFLKEISAHM